MELKDYILVEFDGLDRGMTRAISGLTHEELAWRPSSECNSIGLILFHVAKFEDSFTNKRLQDKAEAWEMGKWYQRLNLAQNEAGAHYTAEQVNAFPLPGREELLAYHTEVRGQTKDYLNNTTPDIFEKKITLPHFGERTIAAIFSLMVAHASQHVGEISYLRGIQRGMDK